MNPENTLTYILRNTSPSLRNLFYELRIKILSLGDVREKVWGLRYCNYYVSSVRFLEVQPQSRNNRLSIVAKIDNNQIDDYKGFACRVPESFRWGNLNTRFSITEFEEIERAMHLIRLAYKFVQ